MHFSLILIALTVMPSDAPPLIGPQNMRLTLHEATTFDSVKDLSSDSLPLLATSNPPSAWDSPHAAPLASSMPHMASEMPSMNNGPVGDVAFAGSIDSEACSTGKKYALCGWHHGGGNPDMLKRHLAAWHLTTSDMYPYTPYFPVYHGNYYFRPYYWAHILRDQSLASQWGADPANPYSSNVMSKVYMELGVPEVRHYEEVPLPQDRHRPSSHFEGL
jgi:hypothetical protein